jgi:hypothetical protein
MIIAAVAFLVGIIVGLAGAYGLVAMMISRGPIV